MTYSYVWHDSFICVTWLLHMHDITCRYLRLCYDSFICVPGLIHKFQSHIWIWYRVDICVYDSFICATGIYEWVLAHIWMSHSTHMNESCRIYEWVMAHICATHVYDSFICATMGWLWLVGSIKSYVSFAKETYKRDNILQKRPRILWSYWP